MAQRHREDSRTVKWIKFPDNCAILKRVIFPSGAAGIMLSFADGEAADNIRRRAVENGFIEFPNVRAVVFKPPSPSRFNAGVLADLLGGTVFDIPREKVTSQPWTVDYTQPEQTEIGRNFLGERVYRKRSGGRVKRVTDTEGHSENVPESSDSDPAEFLRAADIGQLHKIAAGLLRMADHGTVGDDALTAVAAAACEPFGGRDDPLDREPAAETLRTELLRQLVAAVVEDGGSRESYHRAMRLAEHAAEAVRAGDQLNGLAPTPGLLVFLRRLTLGASEIEFSGNSRLELAAPALRSDGRAAHQLLDLTEAEQGGAAERAANALANRSGKGSSILLVAGPAGDDNAASVRQAVGLAYALEAVAEISQEVATGSHESAPVTAFVVGERRPRPEESLPEAARRTFKVDVWSDLDKLHTELLRTRRRIAEWHRGISDGAAAGTDLEENTRQRPYVPLSRVAPSVTMIPKSLEGATARALRRTAERFDSDGGIDAAVAAALNMTDGELKSALSSEQVDAIAMREMAAGRGRGFLLADQTGIGKGRALAAMAGRHLRRGGRVLYFTENAAINIPDVWRDFLAVGSHRDARPCILAARPVKLESPGLNGCSGEIHRTESAAARKRIYESGQWPSGRNLVITNYSQFSGPETRASRQWALKAPDRNTLVILDESHNAINKNTNTGKAIRAVIRRAGNSNVVYATATPMRDPKGADLYRPLLPKRGHSGIRSILEGVESGGETAQECFTTMLAEDGVFLRRDHSLSNIEFLVRLPDDARMAHYQHMMNLFAPLSELMLEAALRVGSLIGRSHSLHYQRMLDDGLDERTARARTNALFQHSAMAGGPLANLARLTINAIKVDQVVEETLNELREGRKPQVTFHSTYGSLFSECVTNGGQEMEIPLTFRNQAERVSEQIFRVLVNGERRDAREMDPQIAAAHQDIQRRIDELPEDLPASPLDAVIEGLEAHGLTVGEISGRSLAYRGGRIVRRADTDRRQIVQDYNDGAIDVLIFNRAGATGGSYHASPDFRDQRPRTLIEMETPLDIIKYIQAQGRSNRFGQVARPRIVSVMTGLIPEMRILQQRNRKLRAMGASIDGNRSHPLLVDDVPDFLNRVGDLAARHVLKAKPDLARRLGFASLVEEETDEEPNWTHLTVTDSGAAASASSSLANRALTRSLVLTASEQTDLIDLIQIEFEAIVEELESRNANPLKPKEFPGEIDIKSTMLFSGFEYGNGSSDHSAFSAPLFISTGTHHIKEEPIDGDELLQMVNASLVTDGSDGFAPLAGEVEALIPTAVSHLARPGTPVQDAIARPESQPFLFRLRLDRLRRFTEILRSIKPGRVLQIDGDDGARDGRLRTIVKLIRPRSQHALLPQSYKLRTVTPGHSAPETVSVNQLLKHSSERLRFLSGLEFGRNDRHLRTFNQQITVERRYPVQILNGNLLEAIAVARRHRLGSMSVYREATGQLQRGIVITRKNVNFNYVPMAVPSVQIVTAILELLNRGELENNITICCTEAGREDARRRWLFDIILRTAADGKPAHFWVNTSFDFRSFVESRSNTDPDVFNLVDRPHTLPANSPALVRFLTHFESFVENGAAKLQTEGRHRKLLTQVYADLLRDAGSSQSQPGA